MNIQTNYQKAIKFAGEKHKDQLAPGTNSNYLLHLSNVAIEILIASNNSNNFDLGFGIQVALLHDTIEDTNTTFLELESIFGKDIAEAVVTPSKNKNIQKEEHMSDCLYRIKKLKHEVWAVKMEDRISNLQTPPKHWDTLKIKKYKEQANLILSELKTGNDYLAKRFETKIVEY